jgi:hypothetical protein
MFGDILSNLFGLVSAARAIQSETHRSAETERYIMEPYARGWRDWYDEWAPDRIPALEYQQVWIWRREWEMPRAVTTESILADRQMNVIGLLWKPWSPSPQEDETRLLTA